jgi:hypothetical protein
MELMRCRDGFPLLFARILVPENKVYKKEDVKYNP